MSEQHFHESMMLPCSLCYTGFGFGFVTFSAQRVSRTCDIAWRFAEQSPVI